MIEQEATPRIVPTWSVEDIYTSPTSASLMPPSLDQLRRSPDAFTAEFKAALRLQSREFTTRTGGFISEADREAVQADDIECPLCMGRFREFRQSITNSVSGCVVTQILPCPCVALRSFGLFWSKVERRYRNVRLESLTPDSRSNMSLDQQQLMIATLQANPDSSYCLWGKAGCSKTHFLHALYEHALRAWASNPLSVHGLSVWCSDLTELLEATTAHASNPEENPAPMVTAALIHKRASQGMRPQLLLDDVGKFNPSAAKLSALFKLVNACYAAEGSVVISSNASPQDLVKNWGSEFGETILRRICAGPEGKSLHCLRSDE